MTREDERKRSARDLDATAIGSGAALHLVRHDGGAAEPRDE